MHDDPADQVQAKLAKVEAENARLTSQLAGLLQESQSGGPLAEALAAARRGQAEVEALLQGARALLEHGGFERAARGLFDASKSITGATAGYVALLSEDGSENEVLFLDSGGRPCSVSQDLPMPIRGLRETAYRQCRPVYENDFAHSQWQEFLPAGHVLLRNVLFAPLLIQGRAVGLIGLANKEGGFNPRDLELAGTFGELASVALRERRSEEKRQALLEQLQAALAEVRRLSGLLPICAHCKRIRNEENSWERVEDYIHKRSEAKFTHGICPDCMKKHYPDL